MPSSVFRVAAAAAALLWAALAQAATPVVYRITDLGDLPGGTDFSEAYGINDAGQVAGASVDAGGLRAFRWAADCGMQPLDGRPGALETSAHAINADGLAAGRSDAQAVRWAAPGRGPKLLGSLDGSVFDVGLAINRFGQVAGWTTTAAGVRAFLWNGMAGMQNLGDLPTGNGRSVAYGINDDGVVVGSSDVQSARRMTDHAFLWSAATGMRDLGTLRGSSADWFSEARDINNRGEVVGSSDAPSGGRRAFLWTESGGMVELGELAGGGGYSTAHAINDKGHVVGESDSATGLAAFLWTPQRGMMNLNDLIDPDDPKKPATSLSTAYGINTQGQIVGSATINGATHAVLLTPLRVR